MAALPLLSWLPNARSCICSMVISSAAIKIDLATTAIEGTYFVTNRNYRSGGSRGCSGALRGA